MDIQQLPPAQQVQAVENWIKEQPGQIEIETNHHFGGGIYEREIFVPAGSLITGKVHLSEHLAKLTKGTMTIFADGETVTITAPCTLTGKPGIKRLGYAHDDCVFSNFHIVGDATDVAQIEKMLVVDTVDDYLEATKRLEG